MGSPVPLPEGDPLTPENQLMHEQFLAKFDRLYRTHDPVLRMRFGSRASVRDDIRDCIHDVFARLLSRAATRRTAILEPEAYMRRACSNWLADRARSSVLRQTAYDQLEIIGEQHVDQVVVLEARDTLRRIEAALATLKPKTRAIFLAHRIDGLTYGEIAQRTGLTVKGVEKQMSKAIARISRLMDRQ